LTGSTSPDREHLVTNIVNRIKKRVTEEVKTRVINYWRKVNDDLGARVAKGVG
jgi:catalase